MASTMANPKKLMRRMESKKSHSWWWDSHISPKNSKWLAENLEEMDRSVKRMLQLIDEDGDSFAKKAEMYYKKRPELVALVEEFYRMYRALGERYDQVTGELRNSMPIPSDLRSQSSGISEVGSEHGSALPSPGRKKRSPKSGHRAAGFDFFLGHGPKQSKDDDSTSSSSESESEGSFNNNYSSSVVGSDDNELQRKIIDLESELADAKEKLSLYEGDNMEAYHTNGGSLMSKIAEYEEQLRQSNLKVQTSEEELQRLRMQLKKVGALEHIHESQATEMELTPHENEESIFGCERDVQSPEPELVVTSPEEELRLARQRLHGIEKGNSATTHEFHSIRSMPDLSHWEQRLEMAQKDIAEWQSKFNSENREVSKLLERIERYKTSLSEREQEIREMRNSILDTERKNSLEKLDLQDRIAQMIEDEMHLEEKLKECEISCQDLKEEIRLLENQKTELIDLHGVKEKTHEAEIECLRLEIVDHDTKMHDLNGCLDECKENLKEEIKLLVKQKTELIDSYNEKEKTLEAEIERLKQEITERDTQVLELNRCLDACKEEIKLLENQKTELTNSYGVQEKTQAAELERMKLEIVDRDTRMQDLNRCLDQLKEKHSDLLLDNDILHKKLATLVALVGTKDNQVEQTSKHLNELHIEHMNLIAKAGEASKTVEIMKTRVMELEREVELQTKLVSEGAEEKREAIRQLCLSIEDYRDCYHHMLIEAFAGSKYNARQ